MLENNNEDEQIENNNEEEENNLYNEIEGDYENGEIGEMGIRCKICNISL